MRLVHAPRVADRTWLSVRRRAVAHSLAPPGGLLRTLLLAAAAAYVAALAGTGLLRALYPYPIDGVEPGALQEVRRILAGEPLYVAPSLEYVPLIYGPVYFYLSAAVAAVSGSVVAGLRLVSLLASFGSIGLVFLLVSRETGSRGMGLIGAGLLAACAPVVGALDVGRMDALLLCLLLAAIVVGHRAMLGPAAGWRLSALAGALVGLALLTKQSAVPVAAALLLALVLLRPAQSPIFALALGVTLGSGLALLTLQSGPWPLFYLWELPRRHEIRPELLPRFWDHLLARFTLPLLVGPFYLLGLVLARDRRRLVFYAIIALGMLSMAWLAQSNVGGGRNVELPAYALLALLFPLGLHAALGLLTLGVPRSVAVRHYLLGLGLAQFAIMLYNPRLQVPYRSDRWDGDRLTETLAALPGPIFAGSYQGYLRESTDAVAPDLGAVNEVMGAFGGPPSEPGQQWANAYSAALDQRRFTYLIIDPDSPTLIVPGLAIQHGYVPVGPLFPPGDPYWLWRTGWAPRAEVYAPK